MVGVGYRFLKPRSMNCCASTVSARLAAGPASEGKDAVSEGRPICGQDTQKDGHLRLRALPKRRRLLREPTLPGILGRLAAWSDKVGALEHSFQEKTAKLGPDNMSTKKAQLALAQAKQALLSLHPVDRQQCGGPSTGTLPPSVQLDSSEFMVWGCRSSRAKLRLAPQGKFYGPAQRTCTKTI